jgi:hypothetical protein
MRAVPKLCQMNECCYFVNMRAVPKLSGLGVQSITYLTQNTNFDLQVDLTAYVEKHDFVFDAILDERVSNDEVSLHCQN